MTIKTKQIFHAPRFWQYALAHWSEKKQTYFWHFAIIAMIYFLILPMIGDNYETEVQSVVYYTGLIITGFIFSLRYFSSLAKPESGLLELMQPVSAFEKWLLSVVMIMLVYPLLYSVLFIIMTAPMNWINLARLSEYSNPTDYQLFIPLQAFSFENSYNDITVKAQIPVWLLFFGINSYALATSIFFKRTPMIKSIALGFILFLIFLLVSTMIESDIGKIIRYWFDNKTYLSNTRAFVLGILWWIVAPLLMFFSTFFALKGRDLS